MGKLTIEPPEVPFDTIDTISDTAAPAEIPLPVLPALDTTVAAPAPEEKQSFLKKLFSKKKTTERTLADLTPQDGNTSAPDVAADLNLQLAQLSGSNTESSTRTLDTALPELPPFMIPQQDAQSSSKKKSLRQKGKAKGKARKGDAPVYHDFDVHSRFDWAEPVAAQQPLIADSNRNNADILALLEKASAQISGQEEFAKQNTLQTAHEDVSVNLPELPPLPDAATPVVDMMAASDSAQNTVMSPDMPQIDTNAHAHFKKIAATHAKIRSALDRQMKKRNGQLTKQEMTALLKQYDEHIEHKIESKELELSMRTRKLQSWAAILKKKESKITAAQKYLKKFEHAVNEKEKALNAIIAAHVESQLAKRLSREKKLLAAELAKTRTLTTQLQRKLDTIEKDRVRMETQFLTAKKRLESTAAASREKQEKETAAFLESERTKLNNLQEMYEKKLAELTAERDAFEKRKKDALDLLSKADHVADELKTVKEIRNFIEHDKKKVEQKLSHNKELEGAIRRSEELLKKERADVERLAFSKYITTNLRTIGEQPREQQVNYQIMPLYDLIDAARKSLDAGDIDTAKHTYNKVKGMFERANLEKLEREAVYNAVRELYNDIQLAILDRKLQQEI